MSPGFVFTNVRLKYLIITIIILSIMGERSTFFPFCAKISLSIKLVIPDLSLLGECIEARSAIFSGQITVKWKLNLRIILFRG